jgi:superfamily II DNA or RNA helicase
MESWLVDFFQKTWSCDPRDWQNEAFEKLIRTLKRDVLINVTPAGGKTRFGVTVAAYLLATGHIDWIVVIVPTTALLIEWTNEFASAGIHLDPRFNKEFALGGDFQGIVTTYASVCTTPHVYRYQFRARTLVIADECHHLGDELSWGINFRDAFGEKELYRLLTTGTAFRNDTCAIPFCQYDISGKIVTDFSYGYANALADGIVRQVSFPTWDATIAEFIRGGKKFEVTFDPSRDEQEWDDALRCSIDRESEFLKDMIVRANTQLQSELLRGKSDPGAGGIFFGNRCEDLDWIQRNLFDPLGVRSVVVHAESDDPDGTIDRMRYDPSLEWILCVRKVTEGVSIRRLRVAVHATLWRSALSFRQMLGRILRRIGEADAEAFYYLPKHPKLVEEALRIAEEILHSREILLDRESEKREYGEQFNKTKFIPLGADGQESDHIFQGESIGMAEITLATTVALAAGVCAHVSADVVAKILKASSSVTTMDPVKSPQIRPMREQKDRLSKKVSTLVRNAAVLLRDKKQYDEVGLAVRFIYNKILAPLDGFHQGQKDQCSLEQLKARVARMEAYLQELTR